LCDGASHQVLFLFQQLLHPDPNARAQSMREVLSHPFFGIGELKGDAPVFDRPTLGYASATNTVDINAFTDESFKHGNGIIMESEVMTFSPIKDGMPSLMEVDIEEVASDVSEEAVPSSKPGPDPPVLDIAVPAEVNPRAVETKPPVVISRSSPQAQPSATLAPVLADSTPNTVTAAPTKKSKFGIKKRMSGNLFGKKK